MDWLFVEGVGVWWCFFDWLVLVFVFGYVCIVVWFDVVLCECNCLFVELVEFDLGWFDVIEV